MQFEQHLQSEFVRPAEQVLVFSPAETGGNQQHGVSPCEPCFIELILIDYKIFPENWDVYLRTDSADVVQAAAEIFSISQDRSEEHTSELQSPDQLVCRL